MKYGFFNLLIFLFFSIQAYSQTNLEIIKSNIDTLSIFDNDYNLLIISNNNCGHCIIALKEIQSVSDNVCVIVVDFGPKEGRLKLKQNYSYIFIDGKKIKGLDSPDFFPQLFLYKKNELLWKKKGWFNKNLQKIKSKINRH